MNCYKFVPRLDLYVSTCILCGDGNPPNVTSFFGDTLCYPSYWTVPTTLDSYELLWSTPPNQNTPPLSVISEDSTWTFYSSTPRRLFWEGTRKRTVNVYKIFLWKVEPTLELLSGKKEDRLGTNNTKDSFLHRIYFAPNEFPFTTVFFLPLSFIKFQYFWSLNINEN